MTPNNACAALSMLGKWESVKPARESSDLGPVGAPRARLARCFAVCGSSPPHACSWMCQQRNRAMRSLVNPGGGAVRNVARHRLRSASRPSDRIRSISASTDSRSNEERGMAVRQPCVLADFSVSARHSSPRCGRCARHPASRTRLSGRASCAPLRSKSHGPSGAASRSPS